MNNKMKNSVIVEIAIIIIVFIIIIIYIKTFYRDGYDYVSGQLDLPRHR